MTTSDMDLESLRKRARAADIYVPDDPEELGLLSMRALVESTTGTAQPARPEVAVRLHGAGVPDHEVPVREAAGVLASIQEAVSSIGQALRHEPTIHGSIQTRILKATELMMSPTITAGSVVFHLSAVGEQVTGDEAPGLTGSDTLVDAAMSELFTVLEQSEASGLDSIELARGLRRLGPRTAKHLSDLTNRVTTDDIDIDFSWRNPAGRHRRASLQRPAALTLSRAIELNKEEIKVVSLTGILVTVSAVARAELRTEAGERVKMHVDAAVAPTLGPYYHHRVAVQVERTTVWSTTTGKEKRTFRLLGIELEDSEQSGPEPAPPEGADKNGGSSA